MHDILQNTWKYIKRERKNVEFISPCVFFVDSDQNSVRCSLSNTVVVGYSLRYWNRIEDQLNKYYFNSSEKKRVFVWIEVAIMQ